MLFFVGFAVALGLVGVILLLEVLIATERNVTLTRYIREEVKQVLPKKQAEIISATSNLEAAQKEKIAKNKAEGRSTNLDEL